jgi:peptidyl-prolyl cis-trans isomerase D
VLEGLVDRFVLAEDAKRLGITVSDEDITRELANGRAHVSLPAEHMAQLAYPLGLGEDLVRYIPVKNHTTKKFDPKVYEKEVRGISKMSPSDFRDFQREEILAQRMRDIVRERVHVGEGEAFDQFAREKSTATVGYVKLDRRFYVETVIDTSPKAVDAWSEKNKDEVTKVFDSRKSHFLPECRVLRHILAKVDQNAIDPEDAKAKAKKRIEEAQDRLKKGEDFADVARDMSDDPTSARGGELGCVQKGKMVKPFEDAAFALEPGKVSAPVESEFGYHLIKVDQIAKDADAEKVGRAQTALELYVSQESERLAAEGAKEILAAVRGGKTLDDALATYLAEIAPKAKAEKSDKKDEKKKGDKNDDKKKADDAHTKVTFENHPDRPRVDTSLPFTAAGDPISGIRPGTSAASIAFALEKPGDVPNDIVPLESGYAVLQLKEKTPATKEQWEKDREFYMSAMRNAKQQDALVGYITRLRGNLEVKPNGAIVNEPKVKDEDKGGPPPGEDE